MTRRAVTCKCGAGLDFWTDGNGRLLERSIPCTCPPKPAAVLETDLEPEPRPRRCMDCDGELGHPQALRCPPCAIVDRRQRSRERYRRKAAQRSPGREIATRQSVSDERAEEIAEFRRAGRTVAEAMRKFGVSRRTVYRAAQRAARGEDSSRPKAGTPAHLGVLERGRLRTMIARMVVDDPDTSNDAIAQAFAAEVGIRVNEAYVRMHRLQMGLPSRAPGRRAA